MCSGNEGDFDALLDALSVPAYKMTIFKSWNYGVGTTTQEITVDGNMVIVVANELGLITKTTELVVGGGPQPAEVQGTAVQASPVWQEDGSLLVTTESDLSMLRTMEGSQMVLVIKKGSIEVKRIFSSKK